MSEPDLEGLRGMSEPGFRKIIGILMKDTITVYRLRLAKN